MSKFKAGDKVRLKSLEKIGDTYGITKGYLETMMGKTLTISNVLDYSNSGCGCFYTIKGEQYHLSFYEDLFELVENTFYKTLPNDFTGKLTIEKGQVIEKEDKGEILDEVEKEYLKAVINPFRKRVENITKFSCIGGYHTEKEYIYIKVYGDTPITLPYFKKNTMYKGMEPHKDYTLEELGL